MQTSDATYPIAMYGMMLRIIANIGLLIVEIVNLVEYNYTLYSGIIRLSLEIVVFACIMIKFKQYYKTI